MINIQIVLFSGVNRWEIELAVLTCKEDKEEERMKRRKKEGVWKEDTNKRDIEMQRHTWRDTKTDIHTERGKEERALIIIIPIEILPSFTQLKDPRKVILLESTDLNNNLFMYHSTKRI